MAQSLPSKVSVNNGKVQIAVPGEEIFFLDQEIARRIIERDSAVAAAIEGRNPRAVVRVTRAQSVLVWQARAVLELATDLRSALLINEIPSPLPPEEPTPRDRHAPVPRPDGARAEIYCQPSALETLDRQLRERFEGDALPGAPSGDQRQQLQELLEQVASVGDPAELDAYARRVSPMQARLLLAALPTLDGQPILAERVAWVAAVAAPRSFAAKTVALIRLFHLHPVGAMAADVFLASAREDASRFWRVLARSSLDREVAPLLTLMPESGGWLALAEEHRLPLQAPHGAAKSLANALLLHGTAALLLNQTDGDLGQAFSLLTRDEWPDAINHYFTEVPPEKSPFALELVEQEMGRPSNSTDPRWQSVTSDLRLAIDTAFRLIALAGFFDESSERFKYWRNYASRMREVQPRLDGSALIMDFGSFGVIEFCETGNAAYFYSREGLTAVRSKRTRYVTDLKRRNVTGYLFKLNHTRGWRSAFNSKLVELFLTMK